MGLAYCLSHLCPRSIARSLPEVLQGWGVVQR